MVGKQILIYILYIMIIDTIPLYRKGVRESYFFTCFCNYSEEFVIYNDALIEVKWNEMKVAQLCPTLCDPTDYTDIGILQARTLEWVALPFSRESSWIKPGSPALQADSLPAKPPGKPDVFIISKLNLKVKEQ